MAGRNVQHMSDFELAREFREAVARSANAARQAALLSHLMQARGVGTLKGEEDAEVEGLLVEAGRRSLDARSEVQIFA
jgi:hypothetical protein